jgi:hypothetical protein
VVGDALGAAELAARSPLVEPRPFGAPPCAHTEPLQSPSSMESTTRTKPIHLMFASSGVRIDNPPRNVGFRLGAGSSMN